MTWEPGSQDPRRQQGQEQPQQPAGDPYGQAQQQPAGDPHYQAQQTDGDYYGASQQPGTTAYHATRPERPEGGYEGAAYPSYDAAQPQYAPSQPYAPRPATIAYGAPPENNGYAVASLILAIVGIVVGIIPFFIGLFLSFVPCVLGIVFGILGINRSRQLQGRGFRLAMAGLVIAAINFLLYFTGYGIIW
ncbi:DUF4190 domain-containing protein [Naasia sp. SYSU D00948]|uniref:DUF4190 domain-containing protein n=1 Tax=Naasia sp. SYSU D00948 TaxID=2817379 RepID=UPI001B30DC6B|nr:DUF4190 domain-containing protein [Naasia sp. SYSU D00948]